LGTQLAHSSSYHPQSDGQTEIVNTFLEGYLRCFVSDKQTQLFKCLLLAECWYKTSFHTATKMTPFMALYGYHPPSGMILGAKFFSWANFPWFFQKKRFTILKMIRTNSIG
jgi:hypothetical protein